APVHLPSCLLDLKAGFLRVFVRKVSWGPVARDAALFRPTLERCYALSDAALVSLRPGKWISENLQVGYGRDGFPLDEPGVYEVGAELLLPLVEGRHRVVASPLRVQVAAPHDVSEDDDAFALLKPKAGFWLALGGTAALSSM